jgi:hypothetical protein
LGFLIFDLRLDAINRKSKIPNQKFWLISFLLALFPRQGSDNFSTEAVKEFGEIPHGFMTLTLRSFIHMKKK